LHAYVVRSGHAVLVDPALDGLLVAPRDDWVEHPIANRRQVVGREAGAQQPVGVVRQLDIGTQPVGSDGARFGTILGQQDGQLGQQQRTVAQNLSGLAGVLGCVVDVYPQMTQIGVVPA
jgi:hypothetical protein